jgi:hypothetical protein
MNTQFGYPQILMSAFEGRPDVALRRLNFCFWTHSRQSTVKFAVMHNTRLLIDMVRSSV